MSEDWKDGYKAALRYVVLILKNRQDIAPDLIAEIETIPDRMYIVSDGPAEQKGK